jgi:hypothetical protein
MLYREMIGVCSEIHTKHISLICNKCHKSKLVIFQEKSLKVLNAVIFYECNDDTPDLQR